MDRHDTRQTLFSEVLLPLRLPKVFTYRIPFDLNEEAIVGKRVIVPFGKNKTLAGIIIKLSERPPKHYEAKYIFDIIDDQAIIDDVQLKLWWWIASYYMCTTGEVMNAALPAGLKLEGSSKLILNPDFNWSNNEHGEIETQILTILENHVEMPLSTLVKLLKPKSIYKYIRSLYMKGDLLIQENLEQRYKPKFEKHLSLNKDFQAEEQLHELFNKLERRAPKQLQVLMTMLNQREQEMFSLKELVEKGASKAAINALLGKSVLDLHMVETSRLIQQKSSQDEISLSPSQEKVRKAIQNSFEANKAALLHGVTSSGKTLIYIDFIKEMLKKGKQVLYLLPEIALTSQLVTRLAAHFGEQMVVSHSKFSTNERVEVYYKIRNAEPLLIVGTRSAIFLPFKELSLIIVDEEHESSFKQHEPAPRFHARDTALYLAQLHKSHVLLGSATPSIESYHNALSGKYELIELHERYDESSMPEVELVDMLTQKKQKRNSGVFSDTLLNALLQTKKDGKQSILFQNKKGYVPILECTQCGWTPHCINCDISLTYYKYQNNLRCHYCAYTRPPVSQCGACGNNALEMIGYGTERIEDELNLYAPELKTQRLDYNTTRRKTSHEKIIKAFAQGDIDVLIGTQMVAKGLDFQNVRTVGVVNADHLLNFPDFRAHERAFQLMTQVAGRAGRRQEVGKVYIQSGKADHAVLASVKNHDYKQLFDTELAEREQFNYPPFSRLVKITLKHRDALQLHKATQQATYSLKRSFADLLLGPEKPYVGKVRNWYLMNYLLKMGNNPSSINQNKHILFQQLNILEQQPEFKGIRVSLDIDPI
ncbi:MAG: primosomal protein N' [Bacteroidia bacterium]